MALRTRTLLSAAVAACWIGAAAPASAITLMQAYDAAMQNDPTYRMAKFDRDAGKEYRNLGRSALLPVLSASYSGSKNRSDIDYGYINPYTGEENITHPAYISRSEVVQMRQPLFTVDGFARYKQGIAQTKYSEANFSSQTASTTVRVVSAYLDALFAEEQLALVKAQRDTLTEQRKVNDRMYEKGEGTRTDMLETQARLDLAESQVLEAEDQVRNTRITLSGMVGHDVDHLEGLAGSDFRPVALSPADFEAWRATALKNNPDLLAQTYAIEASRQEVTKQRGGHAPRLDFVASYSKSQSDTISQYNQDINQRSIGFQLSIPLYNGGAVSASTRQAAANLEKARAEMDSKTDKVLADLRREFNGVQTNIAKIYALDKAVASARLLVTATQQSIKGGVRINLDLLNAQQQLYTSLRDQAHARYDYLLGSLRLRAAAGTLSYSDVKSVAAYFR